MPIKNVAQMQHAQNRCRVSRAQAKNEVVGKIAKAEFMNGIMRTAESSYTTNKASTWGEFNPGTGERTKDAEPGRTTSK
jgi:hypothetical protein